MHPTSVEEVFTFLQRKRGRGQSVVGDNWPNAFLGRPWVIIIFIGQNLSCILLDYWAKGAQQHQQSGGERGGGG